MTSEVNDQSNISDFIYMVLKSRDYVFTMSIRNCLLYCRLVYVYVYIKMLILRAAVVANKGVRSVDL